MRLLLALLFSSSIFADYSNHPRSQFVIETLIEDHGFTKDYVLKVLSAAEKQDSILQSMSSPAEFTLTWDRYKKIFLDQNRIDNGKAFIKQNLKVLKKAEKDFGVPKEIIVSILGVETRYGKIMGNHRVLDSLTTLGFDFPRRADFFRQELINFFILCRENNLDPLSINGSYAGAMGYGQFISSSYRAYAVDYDGDNNADLFNSKSDAIGSIANYLQIHGWQPSSDIIKPISFNQARNPQKAENNLRTFIPLKFESGIKEEYKVKKGDTLSKIALEYGISVDTLKQQNNIDNEDFVMAGSQLFIDTQEVSYFLGTENFVAITKYNYSHFYAMVVYNLAKEFGL